MELDLEELTTDLIHYLINASLYDSFIEEYGYDDEEIQKTLEIN